VAPGLLQRVTATPADLGRCYDAAHQFSDAEDAFKDLKLSRR
jgi:hypothetical protein